MNVQQIIQAVGQTQRKARRPVHPYYVEQRPFQIAPFFIAPVLPGETMKNLSVQGRVISDPLAPGPGNILPWWHEFFFFYVKLRDLDERAAFEASILEGTPFGLAPTAANMRTYHNGSGVDFVASCLKRVTEEYFRDEQDPSTAPLLDGLPLASAVPHGTNWADNIQVDGTLPVNNPVQVDEGERDPLAAHAEAYERMRAMRMIDMSFEEYLTAYGVRGRETVEENKPELIRYTRNWSYPTNVVEPTTGMPSGAASFSLSEQADKDRYFTEPGFLFGVQILRSKIYMGNQTGSASSMLDDAYAWLPPQFRDRPEAALREFVGGAGAPTGPLRGQTAGYWVDVRDLFIHGDQFVGGVSLAVPEGYMPAVPAADGEKRFLTSAQINDLFAADAKNKFRSDGIVKLHILGHPTTATDAT